MNLTLTVIAIVLATAGISAYTGVLRVGPVDLLPPKHGLPFRYPELKEIVSDICLPYAQ